MYVMRCAFRFFSCAFVFLNTLYVDHFLFFIFSLQNVQTELVSLNLQFNMAEDRAKRLEAENKELVDRWMARMGQEADAMNKASKFS